MNICYKEDGHNVMPGDKEVEDQTSEMIYSKLQTNAQQSQDQKLDISVTTSLPFELLLCRDHFHQIPVSSSAE